ncbi:signal peptidase I [Desulfogranum mediterraneum]|uniref:signal peptidase I n=1 Tax=Desulfogranum mediterraneum TaxID=160661 RepID=UPI00040747E5|nr:signal peptidase I [Desulfogranum mediterraneum]
MRAYLQRYRLLPSNSRSGRLRLLGLALFALVFFRYLLVPLQIQGKSMEPTIRDGSLHFYWTLAYHSSLPSRFAIVPIRMAGSRVVLLKRVVGLPGEQVAFERGRLLINGKPLSEPHQTSSSNWTLAARTVAPGHLYVVGDNRQGPPEQQRFGQVRASRVLGRVVW